MKTALLITIALSVTPSLAADCTPAKLLTCEQLKSKLTARCPAWEVMVRGEKVPATPRDCGDPLPCPQCANCPDCPPPTVVEKPVDHYFFTDAPPPKPKGHILFGGGPVYFHDLGATMVGGYQFPNRLQILGGPMYIPTHDTDGIATKGCVRIPYHVEASGSLGAQLLLVYGF